MLFTGNIADRIVPRATLLHEEASARERKAKNTICTFTASGSNNEMSRFPCYYSAARATLLARRRTCVGGERMCLAPQHPLGQRSRTLYAVLSTRARRLFAAHPITAALFPSSLCFFAEEKARERFPLCYPAAFPPNALFVRDKWYGYHKSMEQQVDGWWRHYRGGN